MKSKLTPVENRKLDEIRNKLEREHENDDNDDLIKKPTND